MCPRPSVSARKQAARIPDPAPQVVDPRWIAKAAAIIVAASIVLAYLSICLLIYQGGWQLMLHPSSKSAVPASLPIQIVRFDAIETGTPRLSAWWLPVDGNAPQAMTILYLHDGSVSLPATAESLSALHQAGVNIFAIDYRGYGQSAGPHPTERRMTEDAEAALLYLTETRHIPSSQIVPYGQGLGAVLAAKLAAAHPQLPAVILDSPDPLAFDRATQDESRLLPTRLLVQEHFDLGAALLAVRQPKLLLRDTYPPSQRARAEATTAIFHAAAHPKMSVTFGTSRSISDYVAAIKRFLDEYRSPS